MRDIQDIQFHYLCVVDSKKEESKRQRLKERIRHSYYENKEAFLNLLNVQKLTNIIIMRTCKFLFLKYLIHFKMFSCKIIKIKRCFSSKIIEIEIKDI